MPIIRQATEQDCFEVARNMREADAGECEAQGYTPLDGLLLSFRSSEVAYALEHEGVPFAVFGITPDPDQPDVGCPWLLGTDGVKRHWVWFLRRATPEIVRLLHECCPYFFNLVDARNELHIRWLKWAGCELGCSMPCGPHQLPFIDFWRSKECAFH